MRLTGFVAPAALTRYSSRFTNTTDHQLTRTCMRPRQLLPSLFRRRAQTMTTLPKEPQSMTESDWKNVLDPKEFHVLRQKGTEPPSSGEYDKFYPKEGHFVCRGCKTPLYSAKAKFDSGCGWPAFDKCYKGSINTHVDSSMGMRRVEITCATCGGHLGHVFEGERMTDTNERHCVNSLSVKYVKGSMDKEEAKAT